MIFYGVTSWEIHVGHWCHCKVNFLFAAGQTMSSYQVCSPVWHGELSLNGNCGEGQFLVKKRWWLISAVNPRGSKIAVEASFWVCLWRSVWIRLTEAERCTIADYTILWSGMKRNWAKYSMASCFLTVDIMWPASLLFLFPYLPCCDGMSSFNWNQNKLFFP